MVSPMLPPAGCLPPPPPRPSPSPSRGPGYGLGAANDRSGKARDGVARRKVLSGMFFSPRRWSSGRTKPAVTGAP